MASNPFVGQYRIVVLIISTLCVSMMLSNLLTFNFTVICMTEEHSHWEDFTINFGTDVFKEVDFDPPEPRDPEVSVEESSFSLPDFDIPGIRAPSPGFNWQTFQLARNNFPLFLRILQRVAKEVAIRSANRLGEAVDPKNVDFRRFIRGFNFTDFDPNIALKVKEYILKRVRNIQRTVDIVDANGHKISKWGNLTVPEDVELRNITWDGVINGRIRIVDRPADLEYSTGEKASLFSVVAIGALLAIYPVYKSLQRYGCRRTFTVVSIISATATILCPIAAWTGFWTLLVTRFFQGIGFAVCLPVVGAVTSAWARLAENGLFNGALTSFIQIAPLITMPISGILCKTVGWEGVYYVHAALTYILTAIWWIGYRDAPAQHPLISIQEQRRIEIGKVIDGREKHSAVPYSKIYKDPSVHAIWLAALGNMSCIQMLITFAPTYFKNVLKYEIMAIGFVAAFPTFLQFVVKIGAGILSDQIKSLNETQKVRLFNSIAFIFHAFFLIVLGFIRADDYPTISSTLFVVAVGVLGFNAGGFFKSSTLVGRQYAYFLNAHIQAIMCFLMLTIPFVVYPIIQNNDGWGIVFISFALFLIICGLFFICRGSGDAASFTNGRTKEEDKLNTEKNETQSIETP